MESAVTEPAHILLEELFGVGRYIREEQILVGSGHQFDGVSFHEVSDHGFELSVGSVDDSAVFDVSAVCEQAVGGLGEPAVVESSWAGVEVGDGWLEDRAAFAGLIPEPRDALVVEEVFHAGPVAVFTIAPFLLDMDDGVESFEEVFGCEDAERFSECGKGWLAVFFAHASADVNLECDEIVVFKDGSDADFVGAQFDAVVGLPLSGFVVLVDCGDRDFELPVEQFRAVVEVLVGGVDE